MRYIHLDCEFMPADLSPTGLISIALTCQGHSFYAVNGAMNVRPVLDTPWMKENVWRHIPGDRVLDTKHPDVHDYGAIRSGVESYFRQYAGKEFRLMTFCGAQDMVRLHTLWSNDFSRLPDEQLQWSDDLARVKRDDPERWATRPRQDPDTAHHALWDAVHQEMVTDVMLRTGSYMK